jgi:beta-galactosidase/beta-glucuronidase
MSKAEVSEMQGLIETYMRWKMTQDGPRGYTIFHPSAFGGCLRQMQYEYFHENELGDVEKVPQDIGGRVSRIFGNGDGMHFRWSKYWEDIGILKGVWECKNNICRAFDNSGEMVTNPKKLVTEKWKEEDKPRRYGLKELTGVLKPEKCVCGHNRFRYHEKTVVSEECNFRGHVDLILDFNNLDDERFEDVKKYYNAEKLPKTTIVADMKSINSNGWRYIDKNGPSLKYKIQLTIYANLLDVDFGWLIYENKDTQDVLSFKIPKSTETVWKEVKLQAKKMMAMQNFKTQDGDTKHLLPPPRPLKKDSSECNYCEFKKQCHASKVWKDPRLNDKRKNFYGTLI